MKRETNRIMNALKQCLQCLLVSSVALAVSNFNNFNAYAAPGTVVFANNSSCLVTNGETANPVTAADNVRAALYWAPIGSDNFIQIGATVNVGTPVAGAFAGGTRVTDPTTAGGTTAYFRVRAWSGDSTNYENAVWIPGILIGQSAIITNFTGDPGGDPPLPPMALAGPLTGFTLWRHDTNPPVITCPSNIAVQCSSATTTNITGTATAMASCGTNLTITFQDSAVTGACPQNQVITRTWRATDGCGQFAVCTQTITVSDTMPPAVTCPEDVTVSSTAETTTNFTGVATAVDNCDPIVPVTFTDTSASGSAFQETVLLRAWLATDGCGNFSMCTQRIVVACTLPVILTQPQPQTVCIGANVKLCFSATNALGYQWQFYSTNLPGQSGFYSPTDAKCLRLTNVTTSMTGPYSVVVSNNCGSVTSETGRVTVNDGGVCAGGYVNYVSPPGYSLFAVPLVRECTPVGHSVPVLIPEPPPGASVFKLDGNGWIANNFLNGWSDTNDMALAVGEGWFFHNPTNLPFTHTFAGGVLAGHLTNSLPKGFSVCASIVPQAGPITDTLKFPRTLNAEVFLWENGGDTYQRYWTDGSDWYQAVGTNWVISEPTLRLMQAFWAKQPHAQDWGRYFDCGRYFMPQTQATGPYHAGQPALVSTTPEVSFFIYNAVLPETESTTSYLVVQPALTNTTAEVNFFTYNATNSEQGPVLDLNNATNVGSGFCGQLYAGTNKLEDTNFAPVGAPAQFLDGAGAGYIRSGTVKIPGVRAGETTFLQLRVWECDAGHTYEIATNNGCASGRSEVFSIIGHATIENGQPGKPPLNANTFSNFHVTPGPCLPVRVAQIRWAGSSVQLFFATHTNCNYFVERITSITNLICGPRFCIPELPCPPHCWVPPESWERVVDGILGTGHVVKTNVPVVPTGTTQSFYRVGRTNCECIDPVR